MAADKGNTEAMKEYVNLADSLRKFLDIYQTNYLKKKKEKQNTFSLLYLLNF